MSIIAARSPINRPNAETLAAMHEIETGGGQVFPTTADLFADWNDLSITHGDRPLEIDPKPPISNPQSPTPNPHP